jgi:hypothetical protein
MSAMELRDEAHFKEDDARARATEAREDLQRRTSKRYLRDMTHRIRAQDPPIGISAFYCSRQ